MKAIPPELEDLRARVKASCCFRLEGVAVSEEEYEKLNKTQQSACHWQADPVLVEQQIEAERAFTMTMAEDA